MYQSTLKEFREKHGLETNGGDVFRNTLKELLEAYDEIKLRNTNGIIEEFSDVIIFGENYLATKGDSLSLFPDEDSTPMNAFDDAMQSLVMFKEYSQSTDIKAVMWAVSDAIYTLGYDANKVVLEKAKVINSRNGSYCDKQQKWLKDDNQDKSTLYVADYEECKL